MTHVNASDNIRPTPRLEEGKGDTIDGDLLQFLIRFVNENNLNMAIYLRDPTNGAQVRLDIDRVIYIREIPNDKNEIILTPSLPSGFQTLTHFVPVE